jgi:hypothetical protein
MVNYRYTLDRYPANQLAYAASHAIEAHSAVKALALADPTILDETKPAISRRAALLAAMRGVASRARKLMTRAPARA